jgi:hypothetical protein
MMARINLQVSECYPEQRDVPLAIRYSAVALRRIYTPNSPALNPFRWMI